MIGTTGHGFQPCGLSCGEGVTDTILCSAARLLLLSVTFVIIITNYENTEKLALKIAETLLTYSRLSHTLVGALWWLKKRIPGKLDRSSYRGFKGKNII
jgi:hypothetical protein